ncbi:MAG TPA: flagellar protein export ATPase FliI [Clostridiales bacterium]|nr:flagellar protein export ATPase FliI [Clostridiales bacterium]
MKKKLSRYKEIVLKTEALEMSGIVTKVVGITVESNGPMVRMGDICKIYPHMGGDAVMAEVVGFRDKSVLLMPFGQVAGIGAGNKVVATGEEYRVPVGESLRGRILDALGRPMDEKGPLQTEITYPIENSPPNPLDRQRIKEMLPLGVRPIDALLTMGGGQRIGIFAGSGVGKSTLMGMIARRAQADINVITLVGERGREVLDFVEKDLQEEGLARSVLVIATSDQPALLRLKSAMVGTAIAEYFRDQGYKVMLMMDSLTRFAQAQREIGMTTGEPPVSRGFPPSVFSMLPKLLERSGTSDKGSITAIYTVLVDGDDMNEPISDTVRGILDGHFVLSRKLANNNQYPAIDVLASVSRLMVDIVSEEHWQMATFIKNMMTEYNDVQDLISIGAYRQGTNPRVDRAIMLHEPILNLLKQSIGEEAPFEATVEKMRELMNMGIG